MKPRLTVIILSRSQEKQLSFLNAAIDSVRSKAIAIQLNMKILIVVDLVETINADVLLGKDINCIESGSNYLAGA